MVDCGRILHRGAFRGNGRVIVWDLASGGRRLELNESAGGLGVARRTAQDEEPCLVAMGLGGALDPEGFGRGVSWRELS